MASTKEYLDFVMEQLSGLDELNSRAMMGEYILYYRGRIFLLDRKADVDIYHTHLQSKEFICLQQFFVEN